jgi:hypothetical protein
VAQALPQEERPAGGTARSPSATAPLERQAQSVIQTRTKKRRHVLVRRELGILSLNFYAIAR